jgi:hypothetical protein
MIFVQLPVEATVMGTVAFRRTRQRWPGGRRSRMGQAGRMRRRRAVHAEGEGWAFGGFRFPPEVITVAVRWYLRYGLSYRGRGGVAGRAGVQVDHVTVYRWVQRFTRYSLTPPARFGTRPVIGGSSMRPMSRSPAAGGACTGRWTSMGRSSTCCCPSSGTLRPADPSPGRWPTAPRRPKSPPIRPARTCGSSMNSCRPRRTSPSSTATAASKPPATRRGRRRRRTPRTTPSRPRRAGRCPRM